ncbi:MAG TPA: LD-carboxypeptidase [Candidatus Limnocylindrales bacterium]|nr:LD-carboxypeptidase [Candidatus Limnocylindrales bacterium]
MPEPKRARVLRPGDGVALVSPSGPVQAERVDQAVLVLTSWGLKPQIYPSVFKRFGFLGGTDDQRATDLNAAMIDPQIRAIWCTRGGYGMQRIVDRLDLTAIAHDPKLVIGFSDITALHLALWRRIGLATIHGPVAAQLDKGAGSITALGAHHAIMTTDPVTLRADRAELTFSLRSPGRAEGPLVGGNLSLVVATIGTPDWTDLEGAILLLEDVSEEPYRVDRMLTHLLRSGVLERVAGVAIGQFTECGEVAGVLAERLGPLGVPILGGLPVGHGEQHVAVPLGTRAVMDTDAGTLTVDAATVS